MYFIIPRILQQKRQQQLPQEEDEQQNAALPLAALSVIKEEATGRAPRAGPAHALDATSSSSSPYAGKDWASPSQSLSAPSPAVCAAMEDCLYQAQQSLSAPSPAVCAAMGDSLHKAQQAALVQELIVSPIAPAALTACSASPELLSEAAAGGRASTRPEDGVGARRLRSSPAPATAAAADGVDSGARLWRGGGRKPWVEAWRRFSSGSSSCNNDDSSDSDHYCPPLPAFSTRSRPGSLRAAAAVMAGARDVRPVLSGYRNEPAAPLGFTTKAASAASSLDKSGADPTVEVDDAQTTAADSLEREDVDMASALLVRDGDGEEGSLDLQSASPAYLTSSLPSVLPVAELQKEEEEEEVSQSCLRECDPVAGNVRHITSASRRRRRGGASTAAAVCIPLGPPAFEEIPLAHETNSLGAKDGRVSKNGAGSVITGPGEAVTGGADTPAAADATLLEGYRLLHAPSDVAARLQAVLEGSEPVLDLSSTNLGTP